MLHECMIVKYCSRLLNEGMKSLFVVVIVSLLVVVIVNVALMVREREREIYVLVYMLIIGEESIVHGMDSLHSRCQSV